MVSMVNTRKTLSRVAIVLGTIAIMMAVHTPPSHAAVGGDSYLYGSGAQSPSDSYTYDAYPGSDMNEPYCESPAPATDMYIHWHVDWVSGDYARIDSITVALKPNRNGSVTTFELENGHGGSEAKYYSTFNKPITANTWNYFTIFADETIYIGDGFAQLRVPSRLDGHPADAYPYCGDWSTAFNRLHIN